MLERVKELRQRNLTRRRARHGPDKIQHQDGKEIWLERKEKMSVVGILIVILLVLLVIYLARRII